MAELAGRSRAPAGNRREPAEAVPFGPGSLVWDLAGDRRGNLVLLMPLLMQAMHPVIGDAVKRYSVALTDPYGRRTRSTDSIHLWFYGGEEGLAEGRRLVELHKPIRGRDTDGRDYSALNPEAWAWVPLSAYPAFLAQCRLFGEPLGQVEQERLYAEIQNLCRIFGIRERHIPPTVRAFWEYYDTMVATRLADDPYVHQILDLAAAVPPPPALPRPLRPVWRIIAPPLGRGNAWLARGVFPREVRDILGLPWSARDELALRLLGQLIRQAARITPEPLRYAPMPLHARRLARAAAAGRPTARHRQRLAAWEAKIRARQTRSLI
jgi:uncharacterized protein (DUF2236 family)